MTNLQHWNNILRDIEAPQEFIDWSFTWMISAALQRRVWTTGRGKVLYPNMYLFLVAEPGIGKGVSLGPAKELLSWHKYYDKGPHDPESIYKRLMSGGSISVDDNLERLITPTSGNGKDAAAMDEKKNLPLFAMGPDSTTYAQLVQDMAGSARLIRNSITLPDGSTKVQVHTHNSFAFVSTELSNLIKKGSDEIVTLMLEAYDCVEKYEYRTKHQGKDCVHRVCLNFAAGTTPDYMSRTFDDSLLNEGISSRSFFIFAFNKRFYRYESGGMTDDQIRSKAVLLSWLRSLAGLFGEVKLSDEAKSFFKKWYENVHPTYRPNKDPKMIHYYSRKELHVMKVAMALHFADSLTLELSVEDVQRAIETLETAEKRMHLALQVGSKNPLANIARKIVRYFVARGNEPATYAELMNTFYSEARTADLAEVVQFMVSTHKLVMEKRGAQDTYKLDPKRQAEESIETASDVPFLEARKVVHPTLDPSIRWGRDGKVIIPKKIAAEELVRLRQLITAGEIKGFKTIGWE